MEINGNYPYKDDGSSQSDPSDASQESFEHLTMSPQFGSYRLKTESRGFIKTLFDTSFSSFITVRFVQVLYVISIFGLSAAALIAVVAAFDDSFGSGLGVLLLGWIPYLLALVLIRIFFESIVAVVRIAQNTSAIREALTGR